MNTNTQTPLLEWNAPKKASHERSERWYTVGTALTATMVVYGILSGAWSMSISFAMVAGLFFLVRNEKPQVHHIRVLENGIELDSVLHAWSDWKQFWILQGSEYFELHVETKKRLLPDLVIQTGEMDPYKVRDTLSKFIPQTDAQKEKLLDAIIRFCKL